MPPHYVRPYGSINVSLSSANPRRSARFYAAVLDSHSVDHEGDFVRIRTPGARDLIIFEGAQKSISRLAAFAHFGFRFERPDQVAAAADAVEDAGGEVVERGELVAGEPYLFARDPDGYLFEIWYEG